MRCQRCSGMMVEERTFSNQGDLILSRCLHCGNITDRMILSNRFFSQAFLQEVPLCRAHKKKIEQAISTGIKSQKGCFMTPPLCPSK